MASNPFTTPQPLVVVWVEDYKNDLGSLNKEKN